MLKELGHIEGFEGGFEEAEMLDDTPIGVTLVSFEVRKEDMPYLSDKAGYVVRENFVWIRKVMNLGNLIVERRINDEVALDKETGKWKVVRLAKGDSSDIKKHTTEWNAFMRTCSNEPDGTPLSFIFRADPARIDAYRAKYIYTVEQLSACTDAHLEGLGLGAKADRERARAYLDKIRAQAPSIELNNKLEEKDSRIRSLEKQLLEMKELMTEVLSKKGGEDGESVGTPRKRRNGPRKIQEEASSEV